MLPRLTRMLVLCVMTAATAAPAFAVQPSEILPDPVLEQRARTISAELRCLVCQNQSIDDSDAPLAADLRRLVRERIMAKDSDTQVLDYIVARYGEFVLLRPPFSLSTLLLWISPILIFVAGLTLAARAAARPRSEPAAVLSEGEREKLAKILAADDPKTS